MEHSTDNTSPVLQSLADFARPHFAHRDFDPHTPEAILTLYIGAMRLIFARAAFHKLYINGKTGDYTDDPALFSISAAADNTSALLTVPKDGDRILCSADWQVHNIDSAAKDGILRATETLTYRVAKQRTTRGGNPYGGVGMVHDHQDITRTPHQLGATFYHAAIRLIDPIAQRNVRRYLHEHNIAEPVLDLVQ